MRPIKLMALVKNKMKIDKAKMANLAYMINEHNYSIDDESNNSECLITEYDPLGGP